MSTRDIQLTFINESNDVSNSSVVIFQKNTAASAEELAVAWEVIENASQGASYPFILPEAFQVSASDSYGNSLTSVPSGGHYSAVNTASGTALQATGTAASTAGATISNDLPEGAIDATIYKDGKLLATKTGIAPGESATFHFKPTIWIGVISQVQQGQVMDSAIISQVNTELSLLGITSANIVMTGGGTGPSSMPFEFELENLVYA